MISGIIGGQIEMTFFPLVLTFDEPFALSTPTGANTEITNCKGFGISVSEERSRISFFANDEVILVPPYPEATRFIGSQDSRGVHFRDVRLGPVFTNYRFGVAPSTDENLTIFSNSLLFFSFTKIVFNFVSF